MVFEVEIYDDRSLEFFLVRMIYCIAYIVEFGGSLKLCVVLI
jgi:hypothetical protein